MKSVLILFASSAVASPYNPLVLVAHSKRDIVTPYPQWVRYIAHFYLYFISYTRVWGRNIEWASLLFYYIFVDFKCYERVGNQFWYLFSVRRDAVIRVGKNPGFLKKTQPSGFFWVFLGFFGFFGFFWVFLGFFARTRGFLGFFSVSRILLGASRL